jgi:hypothetical protein
VGEKNPDSYFCGGQRGQAHILTKHGCFGKVAGMPRTARVAPGGMVFHVINRGVGRMQIFRAERAEEERRSHKKDKKDGVTDFAAGG